MSGSEQQRLDEEQLQEEIVELRGDLGETVEALVHKADLPTRAKERGAELTEQAVDRGVDLYQQALIRGNDLSAQVKEWFGAAKEQAADRAGDWRDQASDWRDQAHDQAGGWRDQAAVVTERARGAVAETPSETWAKLTFAGLALAALWVIVRRLRRS